MNTETTETAVAPPPLRYQGYGGSHYVDIGAREGERLGLSVQYAIHPTNVGCFIVRFVVHGEGVKPSNFKHLTYREEAAKFVIAATATTSAESFKGIRLNKLALPVFKPAVQRHEVDEFALKFNVWNLMEEWITEQVQAEGFTLIADLQKEIRNMVVLPMSDADSIKCVIEFPKLDSPEAKQAASKVMQKPAPDEDEDADEDEDGEEAPEKDWLN